MKQLTLKKIVPNYSVAVAVVCAAFGVYTLLAQPSDKGRSTKMRDWNVVKDRREATIDFRDYMSTHPDEWKKCCADPVYAKQQFASIGKFESIPESVQFKMYDAEDKARQDLVVIVLPSAKGKKSNEPTDMWVAAWPPWKS